MKYKLKFQENITRWDEGIPLGNGAMGCLVWGDENELRFSLDRVDIWDKQTPFGVENPEFTYDTLVKLARKKDSLKIRELFDAPYNYPVPTKLPVGSIALLFGGTIKTKSELDIRKAEAKVQVRCGEACWNIQSYVSAAEKLGLIRIEKNSAQESIPDASVELRAPKFGRKGMEGEEQAYHSGEISKGSLSVLKYEPVCEQTLQITPNVVLQYFSQKVNEAFSYGIMAGIKTTENETFICYQIACTNDGANWFAAARERILEALEKEPARLLNAHRKWWKHYWEKSAIILPDKQFEKQWYMTNYLLASCSRKGGYPMPLQGVWTAANGQLPPWKGDYHNDLNTQMSYYHYLKANHLDEGRCFVDFLWNSREAGTKFAAEFYKTKGQCLPAVMTIDGQPLGGWPMYSLSPTNQIWLCQAFTEYFRYTWDMDFLQKRAYPYLEETAQCILGLLEEQEGNYYLPISSSPEIHDDEAEAFVTPNSNYDLALMQFLFEKLTEYAILLGNGREKVWETVRKKLPDLAVNSKGVLMLSPDESLEESHRHFSNAMAIHPLGMISYQGEKNRHIVDATIADFERLGTDMWVGFTYCWMAELYAVQKNGEKARDMLSVFWNYFCSPNGFHLNGDYKEKGFSSFHYRPFTLEANMCAADALQEMLFSMKDGIIELFPAIPEEWEQKRMAFMHLRGEKGVLVSAELEKGRLISICIDSKKEESYTLLGWNRDGSRCSNVSFLVKSGTTFF